MVATIITCFIFQKSANLTIAYGVAVSSVMFLTTILLSVVICVVWKLPIMVAVAFFLIFSIVDVSFLGATLLKVHNGGWFTLTLGIVIATIMLIWKWGATLKFQYELNSKTSFEDIFISINESYSPEPDNEKVIQEPKDVQSSELTMRHSYSNEININSQRNILKLVSNGFQVSRLPGIGMFYNPAGFGVPLTFEHFVQHFPAVPQILIFISIRPLAIPYVGEDDRLAVTKVRDYHGCYRVIARYGYMEEVSQGEGFVAKMIETIRKIDPDHEGLSESSNSGKHITYVIGRQSIQPRPNSSFLKRALINFYVFLESISRELYRNWNIPIDDVIEVGMKLAT